MRPIENAEKTASGRQPVDQREQRRAGRPARRRGCPCRAGSAPGRRSARRGSARLTITRWPVSKTSSSGRTPSSWIRSRHRPQHRRRVDHHVVAAGGEVHRAAVERADLRAQLARRARAARRRRPCPCPPASGGSGASSPPSTRSPPMPAVRLITTSTSARADALDDLAVQRQVARRRARSRGRARGCARPPRRRARPRSRTSAISSGVTGTRSLSPVVSPAPVTAQVMKTSRVHARSSRGDHGTAILSGPSSALGETS